MFPVFKKERETERERDRDRDRESKYLCFTPSFTPSQQVVTQGDEKGGGGE